MRENYLMHEGRKGQRWGILNGPPYPLSREQVTNYAKKQVTRMKTGKTITDASQKLKKHIDEAKSNEEKANNKKDISEMSNSELKQMVERMALEKRYSELTDSQTKKGEDKVDVVLRRTGDALNVGISAVELAIKIAEALPKKKD